MLSNLKTLYIYFPVHFFISMAIDLLIVCFGIFCAVRRYKRKQFTKMQAVACVVLFTSVAAILLATVLGRRFNKYTSLQVNLQVVEAYKAAFLQQKGHRRAEILLNAGMFLPVGMSLFYLRIKGSRILVPMIFCFGLSLAIECCQLLLKSGHFELVDIVNNTLGGLCGSCITCVVEFMRRTICLKDSN